MERIHTFLTKELLVSIDTYRFDNRIGSRAEAIRILLERGLDKEFPEIRRP